MNTKYKNVRSFCLTVVNSKLAFYRRARCFLLLDAIRKRGTSRRVSVRPSVCLLQLTLVYCIEAAKDIKRFSWPDSPIILIYEPQCRYIFPREPLSWALNERGFTKIRNFGQYFGISCYGMSVRLSVTLVLYRKEYTFRPTLSTIW